MIQFLSREGLQRYLAQAPKLFVPHLSWANCCNPFRCVACRIFKPYRMVLHSGCFRVICGDCFLSYLSEQKHCPACRGPLEGVDVFDQTPHVLALEPLPSDYQFMDELLHEDNDILTMGEFEPVNSHSLYIE